MREQQRDACQGRARFGRARMEVRRGGSGPTRMEGNEVAHGSTLARTAAEGPTTRQGRGKRKSGSRKGCAGQRMKSGGIADCSRRIWRWPGASRPWSLRRWKNDYGTVSRRKGGEAKAKVRTDLD
jgi:hypothetical protein